MTITSSAVDWGIPQCPDTSRIICATSPVTLTGGVSIAVDMILSDLMRSMTRY